uniref:Uncharacterized protein n=1 Tax=Schistocephalus solidus TaxID=70667 RepID=A0A0X3PYH1_SCHSO
MGQQLSRPPRSLLKLRRTRGRGKAVFAAQFANYNAVDDTFPVYREVSVQTDGPMTFNKTPSNKDTLSALLDEIIQILEKDVEESREMCSDLQQCKLEDIEVRQQSPEVLPPASHSATVTDAAGEREVGQNSVNGPFVNYSAYSRLSDSEASLREFEELEKSINMMETFTVQSATETPVVRKRIRASTPYSAVSSEGKSKEAVLPFENKFWIGCGMETLKIFKNPKDRRIESIARTSGCRITLRETKRKNALGQWQQLVVVEAASETGLKKCTNLLDEKFPAFRASSGRMNCKWDFR